MYLKNIFANLSPWSNTFKWAKVVGLNAHSKSVLNKSFYIYFTTFDHYFDTYDFLK